MFPLFDLIVLILSRLERLQRIYVKVQKDSGMCDDQLTNLETLLQTVSPRQLKTTLPCTESLCFHKLTGNPEATE